MKPDISYQKRRGGYYTPPGIASFLATWAVRARTDRVLEPSCGNGVFIRSSAERLFQLGASARAIGGCILGCEIDPSEAAKAADHLRQLSLPDDQIKVCDFFSLQFAEGSSDLFDAVVGNPPFVRYQNFPESQREKALAIMRKAGLNPNRLTNAWVPFVVAGSLLLKPAGRLAMVLPAELLQVNYAAELRAFLIKYFCQVTVVTFRRLAFHGIQQEVVLLMANRDKAAKPGIEVLEMNDTDELLDYDPLDFGVNGFKSIDHDKEKWTKYYLGQREIDLLRDLRNDPRLTKLGNLASVDVGVVTGMNDVFVLKKSQVEGKVREFTCPLVGRSAHLKGIVFEKKDWRENVATNLPAYLLSIPAVPSSSLPEDVRHYLAKAEEKNLNTGYKCRIRKTWYTVPSVYTPDAFLLRQIHSYPKLIVNDAKATCTDTIHRVRVRKGVNKYRLASAFINSLTFAFSEVLGRSYGGGVLELEPNEADNIPLPMLESEELNSSETDELMRKSTIEEVLDKNDKILLRNGLNLDRNEIATLRAIWEKLRNRRIGRRTRGSAIPYAEASLHTSQNRRSEPAEKTLLYAT